MYISAGRRSRLPLILAVSAGLAAILVTFLVVRTGGPGRGDCVELAVNSSTEKGDLLAELAEEYNDADRAFGPDDTCAEVSVAKTTSGVAMEALADGWDEDREKAPEPQVWIPTSTLWLDLLRERATAADRTVLTDAEPASITASPLAIAMPRPMAEALGWPDAAIGWSDVLSLTQDPRGWGSLGHPEWGRFTLGKDNPHTSTSGLAATVAAFYAATGLSSDLGPEQLEDPEARAFVEGVEAGVLHYSDDAVTYMANLAEADAEGQAMSYTSAVVVQEQLIHLYNQGSPTGDPELIGEGTRPQVPLVALHPDDGTLMLDHPYVVLPSADAGQRAAAADFQDFLLDDERQRRFTDLGFRTLDGRLGADLATSLGADPDRPLSLIEPPSPQMLTGILESWDELRKNARVLLVVDVSGSMNEPAGDGRSRLEAAKEAAIAALDLLHPDDEVGLWAFSTETEDHPTAPHREILAPTPLGEGRDALTEAINGLHAEGGTALYSTVRAAHEYMLTDLDTDRINAIVVLSDGRNEYPPDNDLDALLRDVDADEMERSVRLFPVAFSGEADYDTLAEIAAASRAAAYDARDPATIDRVMISVLSNF
ncbi:vWA domain-containing protein [Streptomyces litchfieldiae]|uniref:Extracellular solute-binding protein n=1 Tax=Streptomyces litchfieldiae TaxID=3075543 RepID=A0ABU2MQX9_9ACTN|nr:extracellular solute-binding protein [Streptomyces sp. DSM 44938]MDT0344028.1 extracellular solute-binding protein [Streptomyces sp. DSM 44938]